jgi:hypothetical protein
VKRLQDFIEEQERELNENTFDPNTETNPLSADSMHDSASHPTTTNAMTMSLKRRILADHLNNNSNNNNNNTNDVAAGQYTTQYLKPPVRKIQLISPPPSPPGTSLI